jgi:hypothetical protein
VAASPSVTVRILADLKGFAASVSGVGSAASSAAGKMHDAFSGTLNVLNSTGVLGPFGAALDGIDSALGTIAEHSHDISTAMIGVGGALAGVGVGLSALGSKDQAAHQQLQAAVAATGKSYDDYAGQVDKAIKHQEKFGNTAVETQDALAKLTEATGDPTKALGLLNTATDLAAAKHESLTTAAGQLGKAYNGAGKILKDFGITAAPKAASATKSLEAATRAAESADKALAAAKQHLADIEAVDAGKKKLTTAEAIKLRDATQKVTDASGKAVAAHQKVAAAQDTVKAAAQGQMTTMDELSNKLKGQASAAADTFGGHIAAIRAHLEDTAATLGQKYGPAITAAGTAMAGLGSVMKIGTATMDAAKAAALGTRIELMALAAWEKITTIAQWALNVAMDANPIGLVVLAIAALIAIIVLVLVKTGVLKDAWNEIKRVALDVWHGILAAIQVVWGYIQKYWPLLAGILLGPFALAVAAIYVWWRPITGFFSGIIAWFTGVWRTLTGLVTAPFDAAVATIKGLWNGLIGFFAGLPGRIAGIFSGVFNVLIAPFKAATDFITRIWDDTVGKLKVPSIPGAGVISGLASHIPGLQTGGTITSTGLALLHQGETVVPAGHQPGPAGPAVIVQNAHFSTELDVEAFMRKAAWVIRTQRV